MSSCCMTIVLIEMVFNCVDLTGREGVPRFYLKAHFVCLEARCIITAMQPPEASFRRLGHQFHVFVKDDGR